MSHWGLPKLKQVLGKPLPTPPIHSSIGHGADLHRELTVQDRDASKTAFGKKRFILKNTSIRI